MTTLRGNLLFGQSGGPTAVINASALGVLRAALDADAVPWVFAARHGIRGALDDNLFDIAEEEPEELAYLTSTPSSVFGTCRYRLPDPALDERPYQRLLGVFERHDIRYFVYNGGNDSMDTCHKIFQFFAANRYECRIVGVPKTIDNDLAGTDHTPGYPSAARYLATSTMEIVRDARSYDRPVVTLIETMGRNAGWLAASTALATHKGSGPDLIYLPEVPFDLARASEEVAAVCARSNGRAVVTLSEGVRTEDGRYLPELSADLGTDAFGHKQLGGAAQVFAMALREQLEAKVRVVELSLAQRAASHCASASDVEEAEAAGRQAVVWALEGESDFMVGFERTPGEYACRTVRLPLGDVANTERTLPPDWITNEGTSVGEDFVDYALPLVRRPFPQAQEDGLPRFARLRLVPVT